MFQSKQFYLIRLMLRLLLQTTRTRRQFVLLLPCLWSHIERQLTHWCHIINDPPQFIQFLPNIVQFARIWRQVITITLPGLSAVLLRKNINNNTLISLPKVSIHFSLNNEQKKINRKMIITTSVRELLEIEQRRNN